VLAGHEIAVEGRQTTKVTMLEELIAYVNDPENGIWLSTVGEITACIQAQEKQNPHSALKEALAFHASFDHGFDADYSKGIVSVYTAPAYDQLEDSEKGMNSPDVVLAEGQGRYGEALEFKKKGEAELYFKSEDNISYSRESWSGTISLWLQLAPGNELELDIATPYRLPM